jgi:hypothetical protein
VRTEDVAPRSRDHHQGLQGIAYGRSRLLDAKLNVANIRRHSGAQINREDGNQAQISARASGWASVGTL